MNSVNHRVKIVKTKKHANILNSNRISFRNLFSTAEAHAQPFNANAYRIVFELFFRVGN